MVSALGSALKETVTDYVELSVGAFAILVSIEPIHCNTSSNHRLCSASQIFDFCITFQDEVKWTWFRPWDITRVIFAISRYLPFIGSGLTVYGLLVIRTWAFWQRSKRMLIGLVTYSVVRVPRDWSINL
ncbi:hypothetical protein F4604DRAFT_1583532 [Suillus subluteus]|nr:hypothetical protein F4604DRAFT_1583532 [Suillus subluteus]